MRLMKGIRTELWHSWPPRVREQRIAHPVAVLPPGNTDVAGQAGARYRRPSGDRVANGQVLAYSDDGEGTGSDTLRETTLRSGGPECPWQERPVHSQRHQGERNDALYPRYHQSNR